MKMERMVMMLMLAMFVVACGQPATESAEETMPEETTSAEEASMSPTEIPAPPDVGAVPDDAEITASGLASRVLVPGSGTVHPGPQSKVEVHYAGWTTDGEMFDSSRVRGETATFRLNQVIAGWTEGLQLMVEGEQRRFWIPGELAYANSTRRGAPQGMLVFDVELIAIKD